MFHLKSALDMGLPSSTDIFGRFFSRLHSLQSVTIWFVRGFFFTDSFVRLHSLKNVTFGFVKENNSRQILRVSSSFPSHPNRLPRLNWRLRRPVFIKMDEFSEKLHKAFKSNLPPPPHPHQPPFEKLFLRKFIHFCKYGPPLSSWFCICVCVSWQIWKTQLGNLLQSSWPRWLVLPRKKKKTLCHPPARLIQCTPDESIGLQKDVLSESRRHIFQTGLWSLNPCFAFII